MSARKPWDHGGRSAKDRGYGREHRQLRAQLLKREPLCRLCLKFDRVTPATIADHIIPIAVGGAVHDINNLQPVCTECHNEKTLSDQGKRSKRRIGLDGWPE